MKGKSVVELLEYAAAHAGAVDLSHTLEPGMPAWPTQARYGSVIYESYDRGDGALHSMITLSEHTGTHIDAPRHFIPGGLPVDKLPLSSLMGRGVTINAVFLGPGGIFTLKNLREFEGQQGKIKKGDIVLFRFGWDSKYRLQPDCAGYLKDWPGLGKEAAEYLAEKEVAAVGCDTLSLDCYGTHSPADDDGAADGNADGSDNPCHHILLGNNIPIIENVDNLSRVPVFSYIIGLPNKFKDGSGSPIRLIAFFD
ncbi:MAG: cyclase family protein [Treponema sp.]|jgi:kynurenine formamidase|nr:cyclase family protein [Treponema sp.]